MAQRFVCLLGLLFVLKGDFIADESKMLAEDSIEVSNLFSRKHGQLYDYQEQVENAEDGLRELCRARGHLVVFPKLFNKKSVACDCFLAREYDVGGVDDYLQEEELLPL